MRPTVREIALAGWDFAAAPATPALALARLSSTSFRATITGADAGNTVTLYYRAWGDASWSEATRSGSGVIDVTGCDADSLQVALAAANDGTEWSAPSELASVLLTEAPPAASGLVVEVADALVVSLNAPVFSAAFAAARGYRPVLELPDFRTLRVTVIPKNRALQVADRARDQNDVQIDIAVQKKLAAPTAEGETPVVDDQTQLDALMALVDEIIRYLARRNLASVGAHWVKTENAPIFAPDHLGQLRQFTSVLTVTYRVVR